MSKSILVIDTPENCESCPLFRIDIDSIPEDYCFSELRKREISDLNKKPDWCPLLVFPEKEDCKNYLDDDAEAYCNGWNSCIDKILGD